MAAYENCSDDECFQDAVESVDTSFSMEFLETLEEMRIALNLFLNNHFEESKRRMRKGADKDMYHALGYAVILYMQAAMTFEAADIEIASGAVKSALKVISKKRKKNGLIESVTNMITIQNYNSFSNEEVHAELCYAELLCFRAMLTIIQDESLMAFIKAGLKIRNSFSAYKACYTIIEKRNFKNDSNMSKIDFESGVRFGIGLFNLMISLMPAKILKLLEFVGFSGDKPKVVMELWSVFNVFGKHTKNKDDLKTLSVRILPRGVSVSEFTYDSRYAIYLQNKGLTELQSGVSLDKALRSPLCALALLAYHTVICFFIGSEDGDLHLAQRIIKIYEAKYPKGVFFLFFAGRLREVSGEIDEAIEKLEECRDCQDELTQFKHICYWELMWCHSFKREWTFAMKYAEMLSEESKWSKVMYLYQKAAFLLMIEEQSDDLREHVTDLLEKAPIFKQKIAGKSLPMEKFAIKKCERYFAQKRRLLVPAYELQYLWNHFSIMSKSAGLLQPILAEIDNNLLLLESPEKPDSFYDDLGLLLLLKGACLRHLGQLKEALSILKQLQEKEKDIKQDTYLIPYSHLEIALIYCEMKSYDRALKFIELAKQKKGFTLENRLHFRCHSAKKHILSLTGKEFENDTEIDEIDLRLKNSPLNNGTNNVNLCDL
ncbi:DgyrCDS1080 [Dimorphilus gyrociliatus]|uniref:DgyrCDS1080 n=1 Tax=Dimorphilus gyrociliatus TaxID=2664684 RepID=A0A7I8VB99_9ANNE|nr:DgyrCDS1080 [Dimorphilus gyrociliatus]